MFRGSLQKKYSPSIGVVVVDDEIELPNGSKISVRNYPLPEGVEDDTFNRAQLARALGVSENTVGKWIADGLPVEETGGQGRDYAIVLSKAYAWKVGRQSFEDNLKRSKDEKAQQVRMAFLAADPSQDEDALLGAKELKELAEARYARNRAAEQQRDLVRVTEVQAMLEKMLIAFSRGQQTLPDFCETEFGLLPSQVEALEKRCDAVLQEVKMVIAGFVAPDAEVQEMRRTRA